MEKDELNPAFLRIFPPFHGLSPEEVETLIGVASTHTYSKGQVIFQQGDPGDAFYAVLEGKVEIKMTGPSEKEQTIATILVGSVFGEMALLTDESRSATALATEDSLLLRLAKEDFLHLLETDNLPAYKITYNLGRVLARRLREVDERLVETLSRGETSQRERQEEWAHLKRKLFTEWAF